MKVERPPTPKSPQEAKKIKAKRPPTPNITILGASQVHKLEVLKNMKMDCEQNTRQSGLRSILGSLLPQASDKRKLVSTEKLERSKDKSQTVCNSFEKPVIDSKVKPKQNPPLIQILKGSYNQNIAEGVNLKIQLLEEGNKLPFDEM